MKYLFNTIDNRAIERAANAAGLKTAKNGIYLTVSNSSEGKSYRFKKGWCSKQTAFTKVFNYKAGSKYVIKSLGGNVLEGMLFTPDEIDRAKQYAGSIGYPVVVKPDNAKKGNGVHVGVCEESFESTFIAVAEGYGSALVEMQSQFVSEYRIYTVAGEVVAINQRLPANVVGDGKLSIQQLIDEKNEKRSKVGFSKQPKITVDDLVHNFLSKQDFTLSSTPSDQQRVFLRGTSNISTGGDSIDQLDNVHPSYIENISRIASRISGAFIIGFDVFIRDHSIPASNDNWFICEINQAPGLRMHLYPYEGESRDVASAIIRKLFPEKVS